MPQTWRGPFLILILIVIVIDIDIGYGIDNDRDCDNDNEYAHDEDAKSSWIRNPWPPLHEALWLDRRRDGGKE